MTLLPLPISTHDFIGQICEPALDLLPTKMATLQARIMLLVICLQESGLAHRVQVGGPAHGLAQFEQGGGVKGVLTHPATHEYAYQVCVTRNVIAAPKQVYDALPKDDILAVAFARLLLWTDPKALPGVGNEAGAFGLYLRTWRPGAWNRGSQAQRNDVQARFRRNYQLTLQAFGQ